MQNFDKFYSKFSAFLKDFNYKNSIQKERILKILYVSDEHLSAADIKAIFKDEFEESISLTAIYQFLNFLEEIALAISFEKGGVKKFELNLKSHHDHIICIKCGKVASFYDETIERRQDEICKEREFKNEGHTMILYGVCAQCQI
ncbi:Fur family transcriptional regulator [Campylobacter sp. CCUG 57310]|uniref:Fur family transcriptional regulator n=1 Tax=Campylobacter sp. CCUG 57310 TaxID=2517362 RepID=UPI001566F8DA|nr:transcriptional repressor [Campylobacter sp. CCUG 57310]QKF92362.1 transcriptional regulator, Fur family [Campylobacter sp. CCUG 57310]